MANTIERNLMVLGDCLQLRVRQLPFENEGLGEPTVRDYAKPSSDLI